MSKKALVTESYIQNCLEGAMHGILYDFAYMVDGTFYVGNGCHTLKEAKKVATEKSKRIASSLIDSKENEE